MEKILRPENLIIILPLFLIQVGFAAFCVRKILKEGTRNLNKVLWILIVICINLLGPIMFLFLGRNE